MFFDVITTQISKYAAIIKKLLSIEEFLEEFLEIKLIREEVFFFSMLR